VWDIITYDLSQQPRVSPPSRAVRKCSTNTIIEEYNFFCSTPRSSRSSNSSEAVIDSVEAADSFGKCSPIRGYRSETKFDSNESLSDACSSLSITSIRDEVFSGPDFTDDLSNETNEDAVAHEDAITVDNAVSHEDAVASENESNHSGFEPDFELGQLVHIEFYADDAILVGDQGVDQTPPAA
jgi:hypothetical protein